MNIRLATAAVAVMVVTAVCVYLLARSPQTDSPPLRTSGQSPESEEEIEGAVAADPHAESASRSPVAGSSSVGESKTPVTHVLRVLLEGVSDEHARMATIALAGRDKRDGWPTEIAGPWPAQGQASEFDLDPVLARLEGLRHIRKGQVEVDVRHPRLLGQRSQIVFASARVPDDGVVFHEARVSLVRPEFWPEFTLAVRDAVTRRHLENVELRIRSGPGMAAWGRNDSGSGKVLGEGLRSPIALIGGRDPDAERATVAGVALRPSRGESPRIVELARRWRPERGVGVDARAPGYAWGSISVDVSKGDRELLLEPAAGLRVQLSNVQLARYAALEVVPMLCVYWIREDGRNGYVHFEPFDDTLANDGLRLENLRPGGYRVAVELGGGSWTEVPVLALEEVSLEVGQIREVVLTLTDPPPPPKRATLGGVISFPEFGREQDVRLQVYFQPTQRWRRPDFEFALADLQQVGGLLPSWKFRLPDLPVGTYRVQLMPFLKVWMIDLTADGAEDLHLELPKLAEVVVETVDFGSGKRLPRDDLWYWFREPVPGQVRRDLAKAVTEEPGRFRFWAAPGGVRFWPKWPNGAEREFGGNGVDLDLVPGNQSVTVELPSVYAMRFEFREDGTVLPTGPQGLRTTRDIRAIGHDGRVTDGGLQRDMVVEVSKPGLYEIRFERIDAERYHPVSPRRVDVRVGETAEVVVELRRK